MGGNYKGCEYQEIISECDYTGPFLCRHIRSSVRVGKRFLFPQHPSPLCSGDLGIITPKQFLTCLYILFQWVAMQIDLPMCLDSKQGLSKVLKMWRIFTALFPKMWSLIQDFPRWPYTERIPLLLETCMLIFLPLENPCPSEHTEVSENSCITETHFSLLSPYIWKFTRL